MTALQQLLKDLPVALLAALHTNLAQGQGQEQANVPGDQVQPELVVQGGASGEVCQLLANASVQQTKQAVASEARHANAGGDGPASKAQHEDQGVLLQPVGIEGLAAGCLHHHSAGAGHRCSLAGLHAAQRQAKEAERRARAIL
eukprot:CAMPEP_0202892504 /NCGR_PEP_ID=MMETSP1392-20130828/2213_1 /ASSEMBLY_ACC=CAM_ASM_000868 /TAXON_ID=225041 /ORGANISM="Chlamydomonas chlamydogama, Strain SAG 11-48b" /LENGTH=143 /DNA_ID=CAMNT_0049576487 /DNA_START=324 /DNA_END=756 /DNA_ORIENTATION=-